MRVLIDGDACPQKSEIVEIANKYNKEVYLFIDYAHEVNETYTEVIYCDIHQDSADSKIVNFARKGDLIITQDYGLASLVLAKQAKVLHVNGYIIDFHNIDELLFRRFASAKLRKISKHVNGPKKRGKEEKRLFIEMLEREMKSV